MTDANDADFTAFAHRQHAHLFRTAYLLTGDYHLAEDLVQAALIKIYLRWSRVRRMDQPEAYARRVVVNQTVSWRRRRSSRETPVLGLQDASVAGSADAVADHEAVWHAILDFRRGKEP
jgi:DNA-directed RNA polymerase specialized sigma24 family protein